MADYRPAGEPLLRMEGIVKRFAGAVALAGVDFELRRGEVHALVGENGAGKSTLVKIMTGVYHRDAGAMWVASEPAAFETPAEAQAAGLIAVHQEIHLLRYRTVAENVFLGREPVRRGLIDWRRMRRDTSDLLRSLGLDIDPAARLGALGTAEQQMVAIARGVSLDARVLVLDEPTSSLADREVAILFDVIRTLRGRGTAIVYISHRFDELFTVCDRVTVLRDGVRVATRELSAVDRLDLVCLMLGKSRDALTRGTTAFHAHAEAEEPAEAPLLRADDLRRGHRLNGISLEVRSGEIVGLAGLLGSGRTETARALFGADPPESGTIHVEGQRLEARTPADAIRAGLGFVPEDRKAEGIIPELSVRENLTLAALPALTRFGVVSRSRQRELVARFMSRLGIKARTADQRIRELSGGNQQKVLIARWLCRTPRLLILDEPTRGIDIGAKGEIQTLIDELAASGVGVLMISSELEELVEGSSRVVVLRDGRAVAVIPHASLTPDTIIHAMAEGSAMGTPPQGDA